MLDAETIVQQVQQGRALDSWRVFRGSASVIVAPILIGICTLVFILCFGVLLAMMLSLLNVGFAGDILSLICVPAAIVIAIFVTISTRSKAVQLKDSVLILLPEGVVQCVGCSNPTKRSLSVLSYAEVAKIDLRTRSYAHYNPGANTAIGHFDIWFDVQKYDGSVEQWKMDRIFGSREQIAQTIIADHTRYTVPHTH